MRKNLMIPNIEYTIINKSKPDTIILIHGLYASSGYWLEYLKLFKNYKLFILNINYDKYIHLDNSLDRLRSDLLSLPYPRNNSIIISHSLGTVISNFLSQKLEFLSFEICPVYIAKRINSEMFINDINGNMKKSKTSVKNKLTSVDNFLLSMRTTIDSKISFYIPKSDQYFNYDNSLLNSYFFLGDHYKISEALKIILSKAK